MAKTATFFFHVQNPICFRMFNTVFHFAFFFNMAESSIDLKHVVISVLA
jgi:hypothetical protein